MSCWAVIPVKSPPGRKSRLASALDRPCRDELVRQMAAHVAETARQAVGIDRVAFLAGSAEGLPEGFTVLEDGGPDLDAAAGGAVAQVAALGASRIVLIAGDLPLLTTSEVEQLAAQPADTVAIAPDRHGFGTNVISLPLPAGRSFAFAFGTASFARHHAEADRLGLRVETVRGEGLARDIDEPPDLDDVADLIAAIAAIR
ncbi:MAG: 2-phospho-L-lactate guanylyltransferase [Novosphingobium sp.]